MPTLHCLGVPHTIMNTSFSTCAYTMKMLKFLKMYSNDKKYNVIAYTNEGSDKIGGVKNVNILTIKELSSFYPHITDRKLPYKFDINDKPYILYNERCRNALRGNVEEDDFILMFFGGCQDVYEEFKKFIVVEPGIGYLNPFAPYRVYESHSVMAQVAGREKNQFPHDTHVVIPNYFDKNEFKPSERCKNDIPKYLFLGRCVWDKGLDLIIQAVQEVKGHLTIAGQCDNIDLRGIDHVEYVGTVNVEERKLLLSQSFNALVIGTRYLEPFGGVVVEAMICGMPVITPKKGAFPEYVREGINGYMYESPSELLECLHKVKNLNPLCDERFTLESVKVKYDKFFRNVWKHHCGMDLCCDSSDGVYDMVIYSNKSIDLSKASSVLLFSNEKPVVDVNKFTTIRWEKVKDCIEYKCTGEIVFDDERLKEKEIERIIDEHSPLIVSSRNKLNHKSYVEEKTDCDLLYTYMKIGS